MIAYLVNLLTITIIKSYVIFITRLMDGSSFTIKSIVTLSYSDYSIDEN